MSEVKFITGQQISGQYTKVYEEEITTAMINWQTPAGLLNSDLDGSYIIEAVILNQGTNGSSNYKIIYNGTNDINFKGKIYYGGGTPAVVGDEGDGIPFGVIPYHTAPGATRQLYCSCKISDNKNGSLRTVNIAWYGDFTSAINIVKTYSGYLTVPFASTVITRLGIAANRTDNGDPHTNGIGVGSIIRIYRDGATG